MKIKVRLSDAGLKQAEEDIRKYKTTLNQKAQLFARALADKGLAVATIRFANAQCCTPGCTLAVITCT